MFGKNQIVGKSWFNKAGQLADAPQLFVTSIFYTFQGEGPFTGQPALFVRLAKCNLACSFCFVAGTMITMGDGSRKPIEEIKEGDEVLSWDGDKFVKGEVSTTMESETNELVSIRANGVLTTCTPDHPILVKDKGWVQAKDICINDTIIHLSTSERMRLFNPMKDPVVAAKVAAAYHANPDRRNILQELWDNPDSGLVVTEVNAFTNPGNGVGKTGKRWVRYSGKKGAAVKTYNFEVAGTHTYVANNMVVHNCDAYFDDGDWMTFAQIKAAALEAIAKTVKETDIAAFARRRVGLVVTGGEPMLQDQLTAFLGETRHDFAWQQIETNGTQNISALPGNVKTVVSPKCAEKGGVATKYLQPHASVMSDADCLKFVVSADPSSPYHDIPDWAKALAKKGRPIYISPMNVYKKLPAKAVALEFSGKASLSQRSTVDEVVSFWDDDLLDRVANRANHEYAARLCVENAYVFNLQGHLYGSMA